MARQPAISISISFQHPFNRAGGRTFNVLQEMKLLKNCLLMLFLGLGLALGSILSTYSSQVIAPRSGSDSLPGHWSLDAFVKINSELPDIIGDKYLSMAVVPRSSGYDIIGHDLSMFRCFRRPWDRPLNLIDARMDALRIEAQKAEQTVPPNEP